MTEKFYMIHSVPTLTLSIINCLAHWILNVYASFSLAW